MIETKGLTHIHMAVGNLERSLKFYKEVFGMQERFWDGPDLVFLTTPGTEDAIALRRAGPEDSVGSSGGIDHFGFRLKNKKELDAAVKEIVDAGGSLVKLGQREPGKPYAYLTDPDGYVIEL